MKAVLSVASECAPLVKTGGLADVVGALPGALAGQGWEMRVMLPAYPAVRADLAGARTVLEEADLFGGPGRVVAGRAGGLRVYLVEADHLFARDGGPYAGPGGAEWPDNPERFAALSWMAARLVVEGDGAWRPELLHAHDWQAGLAPLYLSPNVRRSVMTVHNMAFQGLAPGERRHALRLPEDGFTPAGYEYWGQVNALKAGLVHANRITTVSPTYAVELQTEEFGAGLDGVIRARADAVTGILNGIDSSVWTPATDREIARYSTPRGKSRAREALLSEMELEAGQGPVVCVVSRLTEQKGLDLLLEALPALLEWDGRLVLLGSGVPELEDAWRRLGEQSDRVAVRIGYDEGLSHRIIAGADAIAVPSRFEPCGLTQLYGLRYGTIPVVSATGGLSDSVINASPMALRTGVATGLQFYPLTVHRLGEALSRLCALFADRPVWSRMQRNAMRQPVGWDHSAAEYAALYDTLIGTP